ncbi:unnamed protein product [Paramecium octaurelia]|uniref:Uncharacterized protein n=1 Tax=Paramecium octaurelia TaxID=43137 RepID=A0A8S1W427_PAROT|nr:unnamed protein product [Paramecium octaurelia]
MYCVQEQVGELYQILSLSNEVDEVVLPILINILKKERIQDCLEFLSQDQNKFFFEMEREKVENQSLLEKVIDSLWREEHQDNNRCPQKSQGS